MTQGQRVNALFEWMHQQVGHLARRAGVAVPPPAAEADVARAEQQLGAPLPPSYRRFLLLQDGWPDAWRGVTLLGTKELRAADAADAADAGGASAGAGRLGLPRQELVIGRAADGRRLVFDLRDAPDQGAAAEVAGRAEVGASASAERPVVYCDADGAVQARYPHFHAWLRAVAEERQAL